MLARDVRAIAELGRPRLESRRQGVTAKFIKCTLIIRITFVPIAVTGVTIGPSRRTCVSLDRAADKVTERLRPPGALFSGFHLAKVLRPLRSSPVDRHALGPARRSRPRAAAAQALADRDIRLEALGAIIIPVITPSAGLGAHVVGAERLGCRAVIGTHGALGIVIRSPADTLVGVLDYDVLHRTRPPVDQELSALADRRAILHAAWEF